MAFYAWYEDPSPSALEKTSVSSRPIHRMDSYRSSSERLEAAAAAAHYRAAGAAPPLAAPRHVHQPPGAPPRQRGPSSSHGASRSNSGSEVYERMPSAGGGAGNGQVHRGHLEVSDDDSEYNSSMDRRGEMLVKPSQIKKNRSQGEIRDEDAASERSDMMFVFSFLFSSCPPLPPPPNEWQLEGSTDSFGRNYSGSPTCQSPHSYSRGGSAVAEGPPPPPPPPPPYSKRPRGFPPPRQSYVNKGNPKILHDSICLLYFAPKTNCLKIWAVFRFGLAVKGLYRSISLACRFSYTKSMISL